MAISFASASSRHQFHLHVPLSALIKGAANPSPKFDYRRNNETADESKQEAVVEIKYFQGMPHFHPILVSYTDDEREGLFGLTTETVDDSVFMPHQ